jgi:hypothetical protein
MSFILLSGPDIGTFGFPTVKLPQHTILFAKMGVIVEMHIHELSISIGDLVQYIELSQDPFFLCAIEQTYNRVVLNIGFGTDHYTAAISISAVAPLATYLAPRVGLYIIILIS